MLTRGTLQADALKLNPEKPGSVIGVHRPSGKRTQYHWIAGDRGHPCINADLASGTEATREPADPWVEVLGTNGTSALASYNPEGGILLTTAGASADQMIILPHLDTNQSGWANTTWGTDKETHFYCEFQTGAAITSMILWTGLKLTNTPVVATDNDQVFLRYEAGVASGVFQVISSIGGTDTTTSTAVTAAVSTAYSLAIIIDAARCAHVYLATNYGTYDLLYTTAALTDATDFIPYFGIQASAAAAKTATIYEWSAARNRG